jgi:hypothetical protein
MTFGGTGNWAMETASVVVCAAIESRVATGPKVARPRMAKTTVKMNKSGKILFTL